VNDLSNLEKVGHVLVFLAEAVLVFVVFWACDATLRPDAVAVHNDTTRSVTLRNCQYSLGGANAVQIEPGQTKNVNPINACRVHAPAYAGCLFMTREALQGSATLRVSRASSHVTELACSNREAQEDVREVSPGRN
jgi:hypothetical protein